MLYPRLGQYTCYLSATLYWIEHSFGWMGSAESFPPSVGAHVHYCRPIAFMDQQSQTPARVAASDVDPPRRCSGAPRNEGVKLECTRSSEAGEGAQQKVRKLLRKTAPVPPTLSGSASAGAFAVGLRSCPELPIPNPDTNLFSAPYLILRC